MSETVVVIPPASPAPTIAPTAIEAQRDQHREAGLGLIYGVLAFASWGIVPIYFKSVKHVPAHTVLAHRIAWSALFLLLIIAPKKRFGEVLATVRHRRTLLLLTCSTLAIALNWFVYIWAVSHEQVIAASLGYFINPLVTVMMGVIVLRERLRIGQTIALLLAAIAVISLVISERHLPVVALSLAASFSTYGLLRKQAVVAPMIGLFIETALLLPLALTWIVIAQRTSEQATDAKTWGLLAMSGLITAIPLIWFAAAARRLRLSTMGFLHYLSPTGQFLIGRFMYHEPFSKAKLICFSVVWIALLVFTIDSLQAYRTRAVKKY